MVNVQKNHYYKKTVIPSTGAAKLSAVYKDTPLNESNTWSIQGGANANRFVVSGSVPPSHSAKQGELDYARLVMTCTGTTLTNTARLPSVSLYKLKDNMTMKEGGQGITASGTKMMVFSHKPAVDNLVLEENFDGADKTLGIAPISDTVGGGLRQLEQPYGDANELANAIYAGGTFSIFHAGEEIDGGTGEFLKTYFGRNFENKEELGETVFLKAVNPSKPSGKWTTKYDNRKGLNKYTVFRPVWRWNDVKGVVAWKKTVSKGGATDENDTSVSSNNTIFGMIGATPDNSSLALSNPDSSPWIFSDIQLSQEKAVVGGQALKLTHIWDSTAGTANSQNLYGATNTINPQFTMTSVTNIPFPIPIDAAFAGGNGATIDDVSGSAAMAPELDMQMNIAQLGTVLEMKPDSTTGLVLKDPIVQGNKQNSKTPGSTIDTTYENYKTLLRSVCVTFSNYEPQDNENMDTFIGRGLKDFYETVAAGTTDHASTKDLKVVGGLSFVRKTNVANVGTSDDSNASNVYALPLLTRMSPYQYTRQRRNRLLIAVSGSGAAADTDLGCLAYSTKAFYASGTTTSGAAYDRMATVWIKNDTSASPTNQYKNNYEPVVPIAMDKFFKMKFVWNMNGRNRGNQIVVSGMSCSTASNQITGSAADITLIQNAVGTGAGVAVRRIDTGAMVYDQGTTIDSFSSATVIRLSTNSATGGGTLTNLEVIVQGDVSADLMRVYFTDNVHTASGSVSQDGNSPPSLPIYFPVAQYHNDPGTGGSGPRQQNCDWSWISYPTYWPRFMTIWVNNYRYIPTTEVKWGKSATSTGIWTSDFPAEEGSRDATVFVDSIKLKNFFPQPEGHHAGANAFSMPINIDTQPVKTYMTSGATVSGAKGGPIQPNIRGGFSTRVNSAGEVISDVHIPTYICMGFENKGDAFFDKSTAEHKAALMFNGFSSANFNTLQRNTAFTTHTWASTTSGNSDVAAFDTRLAANERLGYDMFGAYYSSAFVSGTTGSTALPSFLFQGNVIDGDMSDLDATTKKPYGFCLGAGNAGTGSRSFDALTAKGVGEVAALTGTATQYSSGLINNWVKRENPLASVKVYPNPNEDDTENSVFYVDNDSIFREENTGDTEYVLYIAGAQVTAAQINGITTKVQNTTSGYNWSGGTQLFDDENTIGDVQRSAPFKLKKPPVFVGNKFAIYPDNDVSNLLNSKLISFVYVSPIKYWINFEIWPGDNIDGDTSKPVVLSGTRGPQKVYDTIIPLSASSSATTMTGSTYNELEYGYNSTAGLDPGRHGLYSKPWILDPGEKLETSLDLEQDYGYGAYDPATQEGGVMDVKPAQTGLLTELDFSKIAKTLKPEQPFLTTLSLYQPQANQTATFYGNDYTTNTAFKPYYLFGYHDEVPKVNNFSVGPAVEDILSKNLYELSTENINAVKFNFDVEGDDIWYKYLIINDSGSVQNKYDQAFLWAPLNEPINTDLSQPSFRVYSPNGSFDDTSTTLTNTNSVISDLEGLAGYTAKFNGNNSFLKLLNSVETKPTGEEKFSFVAHAVPASGMTGANYIYSKGDGASQGLWIYVSGTTSRNQKVYVRQRNTTLSGKSTVVCDGETPLNVIYTYESGSADGKAGKLYVNGVLEDMENPGLVSDTDNHRIGAEDDDGDAFDGFIEEVIMYETVIRPVASENEFILSTAGLSDKLSSEIASNSIKLFAFDYTNIRGKNDNEVASSKNIYWRVDAP